MTSESANVTEDLDISLGSAMLEPGSRASGLQQLAQDLVDRLLQPLLHTFRRTV
jgi:hypothetical protein